jgi:amidohydrolase
MYRIDGEYITRLRREYHQFPELNFDLNKTLEITKRELTSLDIPFTDCYGTSSLVGTIGRKTSKKTIALRADMDALPITENTNLPFSSLYHGKMHACGHDCHMAMLLGTGKALKEIENELPCRVKLIFQAAEEADGGAERMCKDGVMDDVDEILACHVAPDLDSGKIAIKSGSVNASSDPFDILLFGKKSHIAKPHLGIDAIRMANFILLRIESLLHTQIDPIFPILIGIGKIEGGSARNVVCDRIKMEGTLRSLEETARNIAKRSLEKICKETVEAFGGKAEIQFLPSYPPVFNNQNIARKLSEICEKTLGKDYLLEQKARMGAEDFSFYLKEKPGVIFDLGTAKAEKDSFPLHSEKFNPDENALQNAPKIFLEYILSQ